MDGGVAVNLDGMKAFVLAAAGLVLLLPTFNALNTVYVQDVESPITLPPPTNPRPGPIPTPVPSVPTVPIEFPANCPPPKQEGVYHRTFGSELTEGEDGKFEVPPYTQALGIRVTYQSHKGEFDLRLLDPGGGAEWSESSSVVELAPPRNDAPEEILTIPETGTWTVAWEAGPTVLGGGSIDVVLQLACGGELSG